MAGCWGGKAVVGGSGGFEHPETSEICEGPLILLFSTLAAQ